MDRYQDTTGYETRRASLHGRSIPSEPAQDLSSYFPRRSEDPWALHLGSRPSMRHCQPMQDVYTV